MRNIGICIFLRLIEDSEVHTHCGGHCLRLSTHTRVYPEESSTLGSRDDTQLEKSLFREAPKCQMNWTFEQCRI